MWNKNRKILCNSQGQSMTEYIIILALLAVGTIFVVTYLGDTVRQKFISAQKTLETGKTTPVKKSTSAQKPAGKAERSLEDFSGE